MSFWEYWKNNSTMKEIDKRRFNCGSCVLQTTCIRAAPSINNTCHRSCVDDGG